MSDAGDAGAGPSSATRRGASCGRPGVEPKTSWTGTLKRTWSEFREDDLTDWAAALTYYGMLSLFPALIAVSSLIGLFADPQTITRQSSSTSRRSRRPTRFAGRSTRSRPTRAPPGSR